MKYRCTLLLIVLFLPMATGCAVKRPTIAHTHIGHSLTGWIDTPNKEGLFIVAEKMARQAADGAKAAAQEDNSLNRIKQHIATVISATDPKQPAGGNKTVYGTKQALSGAVGHLTYAATSDDATENVRRFASRFESYSQTALDRCDLIAVLGNDILKSSSRAESHLLAQEVVHLTRANLVGEDADGDGKFGGDPTEYGLKQLRQEIEQMLDRENPPYTTVNRWYLFNLIRLPDGKWIFRNRFEDKTSAYKGGEGGGY